MEYKLVHPDNIMACGIDINNDKKVTLTLLNILGDIADNDNKLNHVSYMCSYIWTILNYYIALETHQKDDCKKLIDIMQKYLVDGGYQINYMQPLIFTDAMFEITSRASNKNIELEEIKIILSDSFLFNDYLNKVFVRY